MARSVKSRSPFHSAALDYHLAGYLPIPLPMGEKSPPPEGTPNGIDLTKFDDHLRRWLRSNQPANIGTIVPDGVLGIDVDGPKARKALAGLESRFGELPETWMTYRGDENRFHMWFQIPTGMRWPGKLCDGIDVLYRHYRYDILPPSFHPSKSMYYWALPDNTGTPEAVTGYFPGTDELSELPDDWLIVADPAGYKGYERVVTDTQLWLRENGKGPCCTVMKRVARQHRDLITRAADDGGCHDAMVNAVWAVTSEIMNGHTGGQRALRVLKNHFIENITTAGRRAESDAGGEWSRACVGAIEKLVSNPVRAGDPCVQEDDENVDPEQYFGKHGLNALTLRRDVEKTGSLAVGPGNTIYRHDNGLWTPDGESEVYRRTQHLMSERYRPDQAKNVLSVISNRPPLITDDNQDVRYLNLPNGLLDWEEGKLYPHSSAVMSTVRIPVEWDDQAECPQIDQFLKEVFPADAIEFAYEILGYALYNNNPLHKAILLYGSGRNGKGTFLRLARMLIGHANISAVTPQALDSSQFASAQLHGKLANLVGDVDPRIFKATETFKQVTGDDFMDAQRKYGQPFTFKSRALMIAAFNSLPRTADTTEGFFSRWVIVPFDAHFPDGTADPGLIERLTRPEELRGLLVKAVGALQRVMHRQRFSEPESVRDAIVNFRKEADPIISFTEECLTFDTTRGVRIRRSELYTRYNEWCMSNGFRPMASSRFYEAFKASPPNRVIVDGVLDGYPVFRYVKLK